MISQQEPAVVETELAGLILRPMTRPEDDEEYFLLQQDNRTHIAQYGNAIDESAEAVAQRRIDKNQARYGIRKDDHLIGMVAYTPSENGKEAEIGILLARDATGFGYATATVKALTARIQPLFSRIFAEVDPRNASSMQLFARAGYERIEQEVERDWGHAVLFEFKKTTCPTRPRK